jgi:hypothetical protein
MPNPPQPLCFNHPNNILCRVQIMNLLIMQFSPASCHLISQRSNILLSTLFSKTLNLCSSYNVRDQVEWDRSASGLCWC